MRRLIFFLIFLLLTVNGLLAWQNWKAETKSSATCKKLVCGLKLPRNDSGVLMLPGAWIYVN